MYKIKHRVLFVLTEFLVIALIIFLTVSIIPAVDENKRYSNFFTWITASALIISVLLVLYKLKASLDEIENGAWAKLVPEGAGFTAAVKYIEESDVVFPVMHGIMAEDGTVQAAVPENVEVEENIRFRI